jgi:hypothetical protein
VRCPGAELHTHPGEEATVFLRGAVPTLFCFHQSCRSEVEAINHALWASLGDLPELEKAEPTPEELAEGEFKKRLRQLEWIARNRVLPALEKVPIETWAEISPFPVSDIPVRDQWRPFLSGLFPPEALIWIGEKYDSGEGAVDHFHTVQEWLDSYTPYGQLVSLCPYKRGARRTGQRRKRWISRHLYLVVECDRLGYEEAGGIARWAQKFMRLRAVIDTGGKSLHCVFEPMPFPWASLPKEPLVRPVTPSPGPYTEYLRRKRAWERKRDEALADHWRKERELTAILTGFGCDPAMLRSNVMTRLPGQARLDDDGAPTGRMQRLLYLDPVDHADPKQRIILLEDYPAPVEPDDDEDAED